MFQILEKIAILILVILVISYFANHGQMDFTYIDKAVDLAKKAAQSEAGKETISNMQDAVGEAAVKLSGEIKNIIKEAKTSQSEGEGSENDEATTSSELLEADLIRVIDGDTLLISIQGEEARVRLIGIDTPESVNPDSTKNNEYGEMASAHTKEIMDGVKKVYLEFDEQETDIYERILAYVWLTPEKSSEASGISKNMLNAKILTDGYAVDKVYEPNHRYSGVFSEICQKSREDKSGLWQDDGFVSLWKGAKITGFPSLIQAA